jgi:hypothetical protein
MTSPIIGKGIQFKVGSGASPETFAAVARVTRITLPQLTTNTIDDTCLDSTAKEFLGGLQDGGEVSLSMQTLVSDASQDALATALTAGTVKNFEIGGFPSAKKYKFAGVVVAYGGGEVGIETVLAREARIKVSGTPTGWV